MAKKIKVAYELLRLPPEGVDIEEVEKELKEKSLQIN